MTLLDPYLDMLGIEAIWKKKIGNDGDDDIYEDLPIIVLWAHGAKVLRTAQGDELLCQAICKCKAAVEAGDILKINGREWPVLGLVGASHDGSMRSVAMGSARS